MRKTSKQLDFDLRNHRSLIGRPFGGSRLKGNPKSKRPFSKRHLIHVILKSSRAKGPHSFLRSNNVNVVNRLVRGLARQLGIELREYVNVGNHLHLLLKCVSRAQLTRFLRALGGLLPRKVMGCEKGQPLGFDFWDGNRPFSKIVADGRRPFEVIRRYFRKNRRQAQGRVEDYVEWLGWSTG